MGVLGVDTLPATAVGDRVRDIKLDGTTGDLVFKDDDLVLVADLDAIAQDLRLRIGFVQGEWFLDEELGVPYWTEILVKDPNLVAVQEIFRRTLLETEGVLAVEELTLNYNASARTLGVTFRVTTDLGELSETIPAAPIGA